MSFRSVPNISRNHHPGLLVSNVADNTGLVLTGRSLTGSQPLDVTIVDGSGNQITSFGPGTQYQELATTSPGIGNLILGRYLSTPPSLTNNQIESLQLDASGNTKTTLATLIAGEDLTNNVLGTLPKPVNGSQYAPSTYQQFASVTKANIKATAGNVFFFRITNANAAVRYFQLHNKASAPAGGDTAQLSFLVPAGTATAPGIFELGINELAPSEYFSTGIGWAVSTTASTFTDSATAADHNSTVRYV